MYIFQVRKKTEEAATKKRMAEEKRLASERRHAQELKEEVSHAGCRVQGSGFRMQGSGSTMCTRRSSRRRYCAPTENFWALFRIRLNNAALPCRLRDFARGDRGGRYRMQ